MTRTYDMRQQEGREPRRSPLASGSVSEHMLRGGAGLMAVVLAIALFGRVGPISLVLLPVTALAWRGCPTCWTVGLFGTLADVRARGVGCTRCAPAGREGGSQNEDLADASPRLAA